MLTNIAICAGITTIVAMLVTPLLYSITGEGQTNEHQGMPITVGQRVWWVVLGMLTFPAFVLTLGLAWRWIFFHMVLTKSKAWNNYALQQDFTPTYQMSDWAYFRAGDLEVSIWSDEYSVLVVWKDKTVSTYSTRPAARCWCPPKYARKNWRKWCEKLGVDFEAK